jgi:outer membrane immunogenic protein
VTFRVPASRHPRRRADGGINSRALPAFSPRTVQSAPIAIEANTPAHGETQEMRLKLIGTAVAALSLLATTFSAQAADIPRPVYKGVRSVVAYYNWTGFYLGINAGYGWGSSTWDFAGLIPVGPISTSPKGWMIGLTLGYNYQVGSFVFGLEGDVDWSNVKGSSACGAFSCETSNEWLTTFRGRLGYAIDRFLPYVTGGLAYGQVKASSTDPLFPGTTSRQLGWTAGVGLEYAFLGNWTAKIEYLYVDLGRFDCGLSCSIVAPDNVTFREHMVRAGINYKFGPTFGRF